MRDICRTVVSAEKEFVFLAGIDLEGVYKLTLVYAETEVGRLATVVLPSPYVTKTEALRDAEDNWETLIQQV